MKTLILILVFFLTPVCLSQAVEVYLPDGSKLLTNNKSFGKILKDYEPEGRTTLHIPNSEVKDAVDMVYFKFLTKKPLIIITKDPSRIKDDINSFDFIDYMTGFLVEMDIEKYVEKKVLTDTYLLKTLGLPDKKPKDVTGNRTFELWYYYKYNLVFKILNSYVIGYLRLE